jgi:D-amino-acid dehydrogenase
MSALRERLENRGVTFVERWPVERFHHQGGAVTAISGNGQSMAADRFVVAAGALAPRLTKHLGCRIPIEPGKGYSVTMAKPRRMPRIPMIFQRSHVAVTPMETKYRIGSTMEFVGYDRSIKPKCIALLRATAGRYLHDPHCDGVDEEWFGWRPMTWDGKPIIDRSPKFSNVWIAAGHGMLGMSMAPGTGRLIKEMICGESPHLDASHFAISRF